MTTGFGADDFSASSDLLPVADFFFTQLLPIWDEPALDFLVVAGAPTFCIETRPLEAVMRLEGLTVVAGVIGLD